MLSYDISILVRHTLHATALITTRNFETHIFKHHTNIEVVAHKTNDLITWLLNLHPNALQSLQELYKEYS